MTKQYKWIAAILSVPLIYTALWFGYANYLKYRYLKGDAYAGMASFSSEKVEFTGFPFQVGIRFHQPKAKVQSGVLFKRVIDWANSAGGKPVVLPEVAWEDEINWEGELTLETDLLTKHYTLTRTGDVRYNVSIDGRQYHLISKGSDGRVEMAFSRPVILAPSMQDALASLVYINSTQGPSEVIDSATNQPLFRSEGGSLLFKREKTSPQAGNVVLEMNAKNSEFTQNYDAMAASLRTVPFFQALEAQGSLPLPENLSRRGKSSMDIALEYNGTMDEAAFKAKTVDAVLDIKRFTFQDALSAHALAARFSVGSGDKGLAKLAASIKGSCMFTQQWYDYAVQDAKAFAAELTSQTGSSGEIATAIGGKLPPEAQKQVILFISELSGQADVLLPKIQELGKVEYAADIQFDQGDHKTLKVNTLELTSGLYGARFKGSSSDADGVPVLEGSLNLLNYKPAIDDGVAYYTRISPVIEKAGGQPMPYTLKPEFPTALKLYLLQISDTPTVDNKDVTISVKFAKDVPPTIGTHNLSEAMATGQALISSTIVANTVQKAAGNVVPSGGNPQ